MSAKDCEQKISSKKGTRFIPFGLSCAVDSYQWSEVNGGQIKTQINCSTDIMLLMTYPYLIQCKWVTSIFSLNDLKEDEFPVTLSNLSRMCTPYLRLTHSWPFQMTLRNTSRAEERRRHPGYDKSGFITRTFGAKRKTQLLARYRRSGLNFRFKNEGMGSWLIQVMPESMYCVARMHSSSFKHILSRPQNRTDPEVPERCWCIAAPQKSTIRQRLVYGSVRQMSIAPTRSSRILSRSQ